MTKDESLDCLYLWVDFGFSYIDRRFTITPGFGKTSLILSNNCKVKNSNSIKSLKSEV